MSTIFNFKPRRPTAAAVGFFTVTGIGMWLVKSYTSKAKLRDPAFVFSGTFGTSLRLRSAEQVNHNTKRLRFEFPHPDARSGLSLTSSVLVVAWPKGSIFPTLRPYTPISHFDEPGSIELMVKKYPEGKASTYLHSLMPGDSLYFATTLRGYQWTPNQHPHIILIAGGAGITPIYQLAQGILRNPEDKTKITLVFGVNSDADILLQKELQRFEKEFPDRFKATYTVSHPVEGSSFRKGYVTKSLLEELLSQGHSENSKVFVCGPPAMETALVGGRGPFKGGKEGILAQLGYNKSQVHTF